VRVMGNLSPVRIILAPGPSAQGFSPYRVYGRLRPLATQAARHLCEDAVAVAFAARLDPTLAAIIATTRMTCVCAASRYGSRPSAAAAPFLTPPKQRATALRQWAQRMMEETVDCAILLERS
jgi:hypothetical protein